MSEKVMLTAARLAQEWGVPEKDVKKAIEKSGIAPDGTRGKCRLYSRETAGKIKALLKK
ncbi:MAG TPA: hypothetical protein PLA83_07345 [Deltaproteobacteria bacterium]|jgi:hypothetical protein|nr:hypothetical protein [Deltaproteobacteria bacterium]HQI01366.1 hypothetical protein [Deltaproteobacteria bacterium]